MPHPLLRRFFSPSDKRPKRTARPAPRRVRPGVEQLETRLTPANVTWTGAGPDNLASDPQNWVNNTLPSPGDTLVFDGTSSKPATIDPGFMASAAGVQIAPAYFSTVTLARDFSIGSLTQTGSTLGVNANLTLLSVCTIQGAAAMAGNGTVTVASGSTMTLNAAAGQVNLNLNQAGLTVNSGGSVLVTGGQLSVSNGATITNNGTFTLQGDSMAIMGGGGGGGSFVNNGMFVKSQSLLADQSPVSISFTNAGTVQVQTGILAFNGTFTQNLGSASITVQASGDGEVRGATMTVTAGKLQGDGTLHVIGGGAGLTWGGSAQMNGSGTVLVDPMATMILPNGLTDSGFTITNIGTVRWVTGTVSLNNGATVNNQSGGVFQAEDSSVMNSTAGAGTFNNYGTYRRLFVAGQPFGVTAVQVAFNSLVTPGQPLSTVDVQSAAVQFQRAGTFQATIAVAAGAKLEFNGLGASYTILDGTSFGGAGLVRVTNSAGLALADNAKLFNTATFEIGGIDPQLPSFLPDGTLSGAGVFLNEGTFNWRRGNIINVMQVTNQSQLTVSAENAAAAVRLDSTVLNNAGTLTWTAGANDILQISAFNPNRKSQIINSRLFDVQNDRTLLNDRVQPGLNFLNQLTGTFQKSGGNATTTIQPGFTNDGLIQLLGRTVSFTAGVSQSGNALLGNGTLLAPWYALNGGWLDLGNNGQGTLTVSGGLTIAQGATLRGLGTINGSVTNSGTVNLGAAGAPVGQLVITGNYTQTATGTLTLRLQAAMGQQYDRLQIGGTATLGGTLQVTALAGFNPAAGDAFTVLSYAQVVGDFARPYTLPTLNAPRTWAAAAPGATSLVLTVQ